MVATWRDIPPVPAGRPSQNLGNPFNKYLNVNQTLPTSVFESSPIPTRTIQTVNRVADATIPNRLKNALSFRQRMMVPVTDFVHGLKKE